MNVLYVVQPDTAAFETNRPAVDIVCAGDSLTGWNNYGPALSWPYPTYPDFLQELCAPLGLRIANGGVAGRSATICRFFPTLVALCWAWEPTIWGHGLIRNRPAGGSWTTCDGWYRLWRSKAREWSCSTYRM